MRVVPWDPEYYSVRSLWDRVSNRWHRGPSPSKRERIHRELVSLCRKNRFDFIFVMGENFLSAETIREIRSIRSPSPRFAFHSHDNVFAPGICKPPDFEKALGSFDYLFTTKSQNVARYKALGVKESHFVPSAFEPTVHYPIPRAKSCLNQDFPVGFIGTFDHSRERWFNAVGWDNLWIWGNGWEKFPRYQENQNRIVSKAIYYFEFADVTSRTQCALGLLREEAEDLHTQRTFEIPACGALQFAPRNQEILSFFDEDREIVCFDSPDELREKVAFFLARPKMREEIAARGKERVWTGKHTYVDRIQQMLAHLGAQDFRSFAQVR